MTPLATPVEAKPRRRFSLVIFAILIIGATFFGYRTFASRSSWREAKLAREEVAARRFEAARNAIVAWVKKDPNDGEAYAMLARVELAEGHDQETMNALGAAVKHGYPPIKLAPYFGVIQSRSEHYDQAEPILRTALAETDGPMPDVAEALARLYLSTFRLKEAASPISRWMKDAPDDPRPYLYRNEIDKRSDADHSVIIQNYKAALLRDPNLPEARLGLAERLRQANRLDEAAAEFETYMKLKPKDPEGYVGAGRVALVQGQSEAAASFFDRALELNPMDPVALKERGVLDLKNGSHASARDRLRKVLLADPYDPDIRYNLARALQRLGDDAGARAEDALAQKLRVEHQRMDDLRSALVKKPKDLAVRLEVAKWLLDHGRDDEGLRLCDQILKDHPGNVAAYQIMIVHFERKNDDGKVNYYRMLIKQADPAAGETPSR